MFDLSNPNVNRHVMRPVFNFIARLRHWQLFALLALPYLAISFLMIPAPEPGRSVDMLMEEFTRLMILFSPLGVFLYVWVWTIGIVCNAALGRSLRRPTTILNIAMPATIAYFLFAIWAWPNVVMAEDPALPVGPIMIVHAAAVVMMIYGFVFAARSVGSLQQDQLVGFGRTVLFLLAIIYFPIGLWWIQPRLNNAAAARPSD